MDPGVMSLGMKADRPGNLWSKYECYLMSGWWDILHSSCFNVKLWSNSTNGTKLRTNERMNGWTERRKLYTPWHKCRGYNNRWKTVRGVAPTQYPLSIHFDSISGKKKTVHKAEPEANGPQRSHECTAMKAIFSQNTVDVACKKK